MIPRIVPACPQAGIHMLRTALAWLRPPMLHQGVMVPHLGESLQQQGWWCLAEGALHLSLIPSSARLHCLGTAPGPQ